MVPDRCLLEVDRRVNPGETAASVRAEAEAAVASVRQRVPWIEVGFEPGPEYLPFELPPDHPLVAVMLEAMVGEGLPPRVGAWRAASDAGFLAARGGIPCVLFGPGDVAASAHRPDEYVDLAEVEVAQRVISRLLLTA